MPAMLDEAIKPAVFQWTGEAMQPLPRFQPLADRQYVVGEHYTLIPSGRTRKTHNHFFACVQTGFDNLPEDLAEKIPTEEHLRKWALIRAGYRNERAFVAASDVEARALALFMRPMDDYSIVHVDGRVVTVYTAKSQKELMMNRKEFQASKKAVLEIISGLIGTDVATLSKEGREHAESESKT